MPDEDGLNTSCSDSRTLQTNGGATLATVQESGLDLSGGAELEVGLKPKGQVTERDPRKKARKYQLELCQKAVEENIIVYLGTGCGKTHIAVLLISEFAHLIRKPQKQVCVFLAPTVALVQQQARVIEDSIDSKVGVFCGSSKKMKSHNDWEEEIQEYEVLVMTPQILLHNLSHSFIRMELIALLIFDECHHAQVKSGHPYAQIMKLFYKTEGGKLPRIFGMTASPVVGKGSSNQGNLPKSINSLETLLDAKVYTVEVMEELESFVASPKLTICQYGPVANCTSSSLMIYIHALADVKRQCTLALSRTAEDHQRLRGTKKLLSKLDNNVVFCLENLGLWGALRACHILGDHSEWGALVEAEDHFSGDVCDRYLAQAARILTSGLLRDGVASDLSSVEVLKEPFFSKKLLRLIGILSDYRLLPNMKCIVFVKRIVTARSLSYILQNLKLLSSWKSDFLVGVHSGLKSMSRKAMNTILEKFRIGQLNLLVATKVGEEGLDIQTCCLVIRFDLPETVASFIQSRGRARMNESQYVFLVDSGNQKELELIESFRKGEDRMNMEIAFRTSCETFTEIEEKTYKVNLSGACISSGYSVSLLHHYCSKLLHDEFVDPSPKFSYFDDLGGTICHVTLPSNAPVRQIVSAPESSAEAAKKDACLKAIAQLHKLGAFNNSLLPAQDDKSEKLVVSTDFDNSEAHGCLRGDLHEMLIPTALKESWTNSEDPVVLNCYYIDINPTPRDRTYKKFALFIKAALPREAERMEVDLHLARGRSAMTKLVPSGSVEFSKDEIMEAEKFQEMCLKIILDRELLLESVPLGKDRSCKSSSSTFYLLLPVIFDAHERTAYVDWEVVRRCLSSPVFGTPCDTLDTEVSHLQLADGFRSISDIESSLIYAEHKKKFYFITNIRHDMNAYSPHRSSGASNYMDHFYKTFGITLKSPEQPLLCAKPLFSLRNLLHNRKQEEDSDVLELGEFFVNLPPELCQLKIIGFSKDIGSSLSLLPSIMHRLKNLLVAVELKEMLCDSFPEGAEVTALGVLEALTTEKCQERKSLERLEVLGDAFLKFAVGRHLFLMYGLHDEGELTRKRSNVVKNSNLFKLATKNNLQVYICDQPFDPPQFFALGRPCPNICTKEKQAAIHDQLETPVAGHSQSCEVQCSKNHHWLYRKTIADVVEALVGAFIVDSGFMAATAFLKWLGIQVSFEVSQVSNICIESGRYLSLASSIDVTELENVLGYHFIHQGLLLQAFVHPSYSKHGGGCYQRLEFLGDAVLDYLMTSYLFSVYPNLKPGQLTDLRSVSVNNKAFASVAVDLCFQKFLISDSPALSDAIKKYEEFAKRTVASERAVVDGPKCPKVLGDLLESCLGAILLDSGFNLKCVWKIMLSFLDPIVSFSSLQLNPVRELRELCQSHNLSLQFPTSKKGRNFLVDAHAKGKDVDVGASITRVNKKDAIASASQHIYAELKDKGYVPKFKTLEEVLRSSQKMEPKLIGYDETPIDVIAPSAIVFESSELQEHSGGNCKPKLCSSNKGNKIYSYYISPGNRQLSSSADRVEHFNKMVLDPNCDGESRPTGGSVSQKGSARSCLYEICAANHWKPPYFECCNEEGLSHLKSFTYKVIMEIEETPVMILECFGAPHMKKKAAAEHAAKAALSYLESEGYLHSK
ncbi:hypothetical protein HS088_TW04G01520 [Tripterygium wilfordii]|uniref:Dicer-like protein 4 n=1 Tax=Tripterygium wilfordii TaxID=458696 RepID=A0A7J7DTB4_TRIWF|nr:dicer-like protein 4 [Tripterygium wilfordii]KAF5749551.1 hypothetical protein HS088_TW04G01520 [Tripterygium wilfordii]